ncbi:metal ABC transporter permease [soil metagenome]
MSQPQIEIQIIAVIVAVACALPGVFLVLRRMALMSDAISHAILLGIVLAFFASGDITSPLLVLGAAVMGVITVTLVEVLAGTRLVGKDAAIGLVFPALFSIAVILISRFAGSVHLDTDAVLLGEIAFAPFQRFAVNGYDLGPQAAWIMGSVLVLNLVFVLAFYKELKLATFDAALAATLGFSPAIIHYALMSLVSITAVGAFNAVGSILVVALMIAPAATAYLLTDRLVRMIQLSALFGALGALSGYWLAHLLDASIAGSMATMSGAFFGGALLLAPERGLIAAARRRTRQRWRFAETMLAIHLFNHEGAPEAAEETREDRIERHLSWPPEFASRVVHGAQREGFVVRREGLLSLTERGRKLASDALVA